MFQIEQGKTGESNKICCRISRKFDWWNRKDLEEEIEWVAVVNVNLLLLHLFQRGNQ